MRFALVFIIIVVIEMYLLITIGSGIGALSTIALVFITAALGIWMLRQQGLATLARALKSVDRGQRPLREVAEAPFLLIGGVLLLLPGFFTDAIGFLLLFPLTRRLLVRGLGRRIQVRSGVIDGQSSREAGPDKHRPRIIEGEWDKEDR